MTIHDPQPILALQVSVQFREACIEDLSKLEWYGQYKHFRNVFRRTFHEQQTGRRLMLVADFNDFPVGQLFISFRDQARVYFYALRVMAIFQNQGIGTRLLQEGEAIAMQRNTYRASIAVAKTNLRARRLYERLGYRIRRADAGRWRYMDHRGHVCEVHEPSWILEKIMNPG